MMLRNESDFLALVRESVKRKGGNYYKTHGDIYQKGMPDLVVSVPEGAYLIELKWKLFHVDELRYTSGQIASKLLTHDQAKVLMQFAKVKRRMLEPIVLIGTEFLESYYYISVSVPNDNKIPIGACLGKAMENGVMLGEGLVVQKFSNEKEFDAIWM